MSDDAHAEVGDMKGHAELIAARTAMVVIKAFGTCLSEEADVVHSAAYYWGRAALASAEDWTEDHPELSFNTGEEIAF